MKRTLLTLFVLAAACSGPDTQTPDPKPDPRPTRNCAVELKDASAEAVVGEFTDWEERPLADGSVTLEDLEPGEYAYAFVVDGEVEAEPPTDDYTKWFDGTEYRNLRVGDCNAPTWNVTTAEIASDGTVDLVLQFVSAASGATIDPTSVEVTAGGEGLTVQADPETGQVFANGVVQEHGKYTVRATASDIDGVAVEEDLWLPLWYQEADWTWQDALLYLVFTDRFRDSDGEGADEPEGVETIAAYQGGDFAGITQAIEEGYFEELGVDALWLSPVYDNPDGGFIGMDGTHFFAGYHGYWPLDFLIAEPRFGGDEELHRLVAAAHERGMRIVFDIVLNHVHERHGYCDEHPDWCSTTCECGTEGCGWDERPLDCQFAPYLPDLDYRNHEIVE